MPATTYNKGWSEGAWGYNGWSGIAPAYLVDGVEGTGAVGTVGLRIDDTEIPTGVEGIGSVGTTTPAISYVVSGVSAIGEIGTVLIQGWSMVDDFQNATWTVVNDAQSATWVEVDVAA